MARVLLVTITLSGRTGTEVVDCAQSADGVEAEVKNSDGSRERIKGNYLIGADGARSTVRKCMGIEFEGFTYGERFMIVGTTYDFAQAGYAYRNYISDPVEWYNLFKISWKGPPGVYRLVVPLKLDEVVSFTSRANVRSQRVMERIGMTRSVADDFEHPLVPEGQRGRGQPRRYGSRRLSLAKRAGHRQGWEPVTSPIDQMFCSWG